MTEKSFFAGFGGQGIISLGQIWVYCGMEEGKNVTFFPFYGAEKRGGIARAGVVISDEEIAKRKAAWTQPAPRYTHGVLAKYARQVGPASQGAVTDKP